MKDASTFSIVSVAGGWCRRQNYLYQAPHSPPPKKKKRVSSAAIARISLATYARSPARFSCWGSWQSWQTKPEFARLYLVTCVKLLLFFPETQKAHGETVDRQLSREFIRKLAVYRSNCTPIEQGTTSTRAFIHWHVVGYNSHWEPAATF